jgi:hypothetical protein
MQELNSQIYLALQQPYLSLAVRSCEVVQLVVWRLVHSSLAYAHVELATGALMSMLQSPAQKLGATCFGYQQHGHRTLGTLRWGLRQRM